MYNYIYIYTYKKKWVPVTTACRVLRLRMEKRPPIWRLAANILNKQSRTADKGWSSSLEIGRGTTNFSIMKTGRVTKHKLVPRTWTDPLVWPKQRKMDVRFDIWNFRSLRVSVTYNSRQGISKIKIRFSGCGGSSVGQREHGKRRGL